MNELEGLRVTVLGLGLHGGGVATVRYLFRHGARVTITDSKPADRLQRSRSLIAGMAEREVYGGHSESDISAADIVVKNPAVPRDAAMLKHARRIETDLSLFLSQFRGPIIAVTGSKGKSSVASLIHAGLLTAYPSARLGGNITVSPLSFLDELAESTPVVLELSSFQLGDLPLCTSSRDGTVRFAPSIAVITNIYPDHQNYYRDDMEAYVRDKELIFASQSPDDLLILGTTEDRWTSRFRSRAPGRVIVCPSCRDHVEQNRTIARLALERFGVSGARVDEALHTFQGLEHRLEKIDSISGIRFYNDSAATVPPAAVAALRTLGPNRTVLIVGGTDKHIDLTGFAESISDAKAIVLLEGSATGRMKNELDAVGCAYHGPYPDLSQAVDAAVALASTGDAVCLSPGAASFELFENEFERGREFKRIVSRLRH